MSKLIDALKKLDRGNDDHWTDDGQPRLNAVKQVFGKSVSREEIAKEVPGFNRGYVFDEGAAEESQPNQNTEQELKANLDKARVNLAEAKKAFNDAQAQMDKFITENSVEPPSLAEQVKAYQKMSVDQSAKNNAAIAAAQAVLKGAK